MLRVTFLLIATQLLLSCASLGPKVKGPTPADEDVVSVHAATELARTAFTAGCVRTWIGRGEKGHFAECRQSADKYVEDEVLGIVRGKVKKESTHQP
ncbi:MAG: hypothetical protein H6624_18140 [Bdellovibrionaceae bacterium]|nr:hypothetical protein [Bdellovibrionales bacterium]MCB9086265.1 hypothetical protein [Pseudobdellovibrionaceae bacterium]